MAVIDDRRAAIVYALEKRKTWGCGGFDGQKAMRPIKRSGRQTPFG